MSKEAMVVSVVVGLVALISGVYAIVSPIRHEIDAVRRELSQSLIHMHEMLTQHSKLRGHPENREIVATLREKFVEVETQFRASKERSLLRETQLENMIEHSATRLEQALVALDARLQRELLDLGKFLQLQIDLYHKSQLWRGEER